MPFLPSKQQMENLSGKNTQPCLKKDTIIFNYLLGVKCPVR